MTSIAENKQALRLDVEEFLFQEAEVLAEWRLEEWLELFTDTGSYYVPPTDIQEADHRDTLFIIADDKERLKSRVKQLLGRFVHAEYPHSRTRRLITNVRVRKVEGDTVWVTANFVVYRIRLELNDAYVGRYEYRLKRVGDTFKIDERRAILDLEALRPHGKVSFIL